jgi:hypothetical protein
MALDAGALEEYFAAVAEVNRLTVELSKLNAGFWPNGTAPGADVPELTGQLERARSRRDAALSGLGEAATPTDPH